MARQLLARERHGVLSTLSQAVAGHPFGSLTPYAIDARGRPLLLLADIAEHARNLLADPRCSLLVQDSAALQDPQAGARITLVGRCEVVAEAAMAAAEEHYFGRFPQSRGYLRTHGFRLFALAVERARFIGGFGMIHWLAPERLAAVGS